jgi:pimeloyl-ACP methyl ester carboxylesterase
MFTKGLKTQFKHFRRGFSSIFHSTGHAKYIEESRNVTLRGTRLKGNYNDLPNLIFFSEVLDPVSNWTAFFTDPDNKFLDYRNVWLVNPRNFGNSDRNSCFDYSDMADDVVRFMWENKISTATLGGHGFGGKLALAVGCYHADRVTGVFALDTVPHDHRGFEAFHEIKDYVNKVKNLNISRTRSEIDADLRRQISDPKWRSIFMQNLKKVSDQQSEWNFELDYLHHNLHFKGADNIFYWAEKHGLFTGRSYFVFPDQSRWVYMNQNTIQIHKVCIKNKGFGNDIIALQGDDNPLNHWMYEQEQFQFSLARKLLHWLRHFDGVHTLLYDRSEIGKVFIPDRIYSRKDPDHVNGDYSPAHLHHNWRFSNIYEEAKKFDADPNYDPSKHKY